MNISLVGAMICVLAAAKDKPYNGVNVSVLHTYATAGKLYIEARSVLFVPPESREYRSFLFSCSLSKHGCTAPKISSILVLLNPSARASCDNYDLGRENPIEVCIDSVH